MTRTTGIPAWIAGRIITMDTRIAFFLFSIFTTPFHPPRPSGQLTPPGILDFTFWPRRSLSVL